MIKNNTKVECLECGEKYFPHLLKETHQNVDIFFLECPSCEERLLSYVMDPEARKKQERVRILMNQVKDRKVDYALQQKRRRKYEREAKELKRMLTENAAKYPHLISKVLNYGEIN